MVGTVLAYVILAAVAGFFVVGFIAWLHHCWKLRQMGKQREREYRAWLAGGPPPPDPLAEYHEQLRDEMARDRADNEP